MILTFEYIIISYKSIFVPAFVLLHFRSSCRLGNDNLIDFEDGNGGLRGKSDGPLFSVSVVIDAKLRNFLKLSCQDVESLGGLSRVSCDHFGHKFVSIDTTVFSQDTGEDLKGFAVTTETVLVESS